MKKIVLIFSLMAVRVMIAHGQPAIKHIVFEAAGIRGIAYCGAIQEMESKNMMSQIEKVGGTSSGAITALAVSLGYSGNEIEKLIGGTDFEKFNDGRWLFFGGINRVKKYFGWYRGKKLQKWLGEIIKTKTGNADLTFEELHQKGFRDLYVTGTCLNKQKPIVSSYESFPKMKVKDAVRISAGVPVYFEAIFIDSTGTVYDHPKNVHELDVMVDGGLIEDYPIHLFDGNEIDPATIGLRVDPDAQIRNDKENQMLAEMPISDFKGFSMAFYTMVIENLNRPRLKKEDWERTISISDGNITPKIQKLSKENLNLLIENGRKAMQDYFKQQQVSAVNR